MQQDNRYDPGTPSDTPSDTPSRSDTQSEGSATVSSRLSPESIPPLQDCEETIEYVSVFVVVRYETTVLLSDS